MSSPATQPIPDYLVVGHLSHDRSPQGIRLGGTAAYAALCARALGRRPGIVTAGGDIEISPLDGVPVALQPSPATTEFVNQETGGVRTQRLAALAEELRGESIPGPWRTASIVHLAPIADEVPPGFVHLFPPSAWIGVTAQGWLRSWDAGGRVGFRRWDHAAEALSRATAVVVSLEDLAGDEAEVEALAEACRLLVVTEAHAGARVYWNRDVRRLPAPERPALDSTGAGDVFAAAFFVRLEHTRDPWEAARFANELASASITRPGLDGVPTRVEVERASLVVVP